MSTDTSRVSGDRDVTFGQVTWSPQGHPEVSDDTVVPSVAVSTEMPVRVPQPTATPPAHSETVQQRPTSATGGRLTVLTSTGLRGPRADENGVSAEPRQLRERAHLSGWFQSEGNWTPTVAAYSVSHPAEPRSVTLPIANHTQFK